MKGGAAMQRITISISDGLGLALEEIRRARFYESRSEAVRDLVRDGIGRWREEHADADTCVAIFLTYSTGASARWRNGFRKCSTIIMISSQPALRSASIIFSRWRA